MKKYNFEGITTDELLVIMTGLNLAHEKYSKDKIQTYSKSRDFELRRVTESLMARLATESEQQYKTVL